MQLDWIFSISDDTLSWILLQILKELGLLANSLQPTVKSDRQLASPTLPEFD